MLVRNILRHVVPPTGMSISTLVFYALIAAAVVVYVQIVRDINDELLGR